MKTRPSPGPTPIDRIIAENESVQAAVEQKYKEGYDDGYDAASKASNEQETQQAASVVDDIGRIATALEGILSNMPTRRGSIPGLGPM